MRKGLLQIAAVGLLGALLVLALPWATLAQTPTPTTGAVTATPLATRTPAQVTRTPTRAVTATPVRTVVAATATPVTPAAVTTPVTPVAATATPITPAALPTTGSQNSLGGAVGWLPVVALLLLAVPAVAGMKARNK